MTEPDPADAGSAEPVPGRPGPVGAGPARAYPQLLRGPTYRWWRAPVSLVVLAAGAAVTTVVLIALSALCVIVVRALGGAVRGDLTDLTALTSTPEGLAVVNLETAGFIPAVLVAVRVGFGRSPGWVASVVGRIRWDWLGRSFAVSAVVLVAPTLALVLLTDDPSTWTPEPRWVGLAVVVLLTTPLQAAGEEFLFRGWLTQAVGSMIPGAVLGTLLSAAVASGVFALAHGEQDPWLFGTRVAFGAISCWLVWATGGLEAGIALHSVNNMTAFALGIAQGTLAENLEATSADVLPVLLQVAMLLVTSVVLVLLARRGGLVRCFLPPAPPLPPAPAGPPGDPW